MTVALICGISGQDGAYLAQLLLNEGYTVWGTSRNSERNFFTNLTTLGILDRVKTESMIVSDFRSVLQIIDKAMPDEIYNLTGQTSVGLSFQQPVETTESIAVGSLNLLEAIRFTKAPIKFYNAGSSECFGDTGSLPANEQTPFRPRSPYAVAKSAAFWQVDNYREAYNIFACSGILFNHESPLRSKQFVTQKIVRSAINIAQGKQDKLYLGNISIQRDWGWAPEYVEAMYKMLQQPSPDDYVIATGVTFKLEDFVSEVFSSLNLDWHDYVVVDKELYRPTDIAVSRGNPQKAKTLLDWSAHSKMPDVAKMMVESCLKFSYE
jgi:GDPmannose 4,6-dehydratase